MTNPGLDDLLALQDLDTSIDQHRHRRDTLPERAEIKSVDQALSTLRAQAVTLTTSRDEVAGRQKEAEDELAATEARSKAVSRRLYGGEVSASRELQAMAADVEALKSRASDLEDRVLELLEEREPIEKRLAAVEHETSELGSQRVVLVSQLSLAEADMLTQIDALEQRRQVAAAAIPPAVLSNYERLRTRLGGVGVARLVGNHCDGCHLTVSSMELDHLRHLPAGEVATCEQCSRILVPAPSPS